MELTGIKYVLLDIEGTVLPISFVKDVLFVYARQHIDDFLRDKWTTSEVQEAVRDIQKFSEANKDSPPVNINDRDSVLKNVLWQMDKDLKTSGLKSLQGQIWFDGYQRQELVANLYNDVCPSLEKWIDQGRRIGIYSSGSIFAQKLLFEHTKSGSLLGLLDSFHDLSTAGPKVEPSSYSQIANTISVAPEEVLFLTDVFGEYSAAKAAGMKAAIVVRDGNKPLTDDEKKNAPLIYTFDQVKLL